MTSCFVPAEQNTPLELYAKGAEVHIESLAVEKLRSAWDTDESPGESYTMENKPSGGCYD